jgi:hypothetical protein
MLFALIETHMFMHRFLRHLLILTFAWHALAEKPAATASKVLSQRENDLRVATRLKAHGVCQRSRWVVMCHEPGQLSGAESTAFFTLVKAGASALRTELGVNLDVPGGNSAAVEIFIAKDTGYAHTTGHVKPWLFMPPETIKLGKAPYLHEMAHVMAQWSWRKSEWFAEGYANYMASKVAAKYGGYHRSFVLADGLMELPALYSSAEGKEMLPLLSVWGRRHLYQGDTKVLFDKLQSHRPTYAPAYYAMSWSLVDFLIVTQGIQLMRAVVESDQPGKTLRQRSGKGLVQHIALWQQQLPSQ